MNNIYRILKKTPYVATLLAAILTAGCGGSGTTTAKSDTASVTPAALMASVTSAVSNQSNIARSLGGWDWVSFASNFGSMLSSINYTLDMQKITYQSVGADGLPHTMTGLLILPRAISGDRPRVPILMYQHGTESFRTYSPSQYLLHMDRPADYPEVMVAAAIAASGYAVAMADYEGLGDNTNPQPYLNGTVLAGQVIDMLHASRDKIVAASSPCIWNDQLFLMGYSEGGYVTMTTVRELQRRKLLNTTEFTVTAAASLSGPHDLSGTMRTLMLSDSTSKAPYFLPLLLTGYNYSYREQSSIFNAESALGTDFINIPPLITGSTTSDKISEAMGMVFSPNVTLIAPKRVLSTTFISLLTTDTAPGSAYSFLRQNDSFRDPQNNYNTWRPMVPVLLAHHESDELVPYGNSQVAFDAFSSAGSKRHGGTSPGVELVRETVSLSFDTSDPTKTVHLGAAFPELSYGWNWLESFRP